MNCWKNGWFTENQQLWPGQCLSIKMKEVLYKGSSNHQELCIFLSEYHGKVLALDGIIQCTEHDEFAYQEPIAFLPLCAHPNPMQVLIVGGGDGGVAREVVKHPAVLEVTQVEIDDKVVEACRRFMPEMAKGLDHPKVKLHIGDGFDWLYAHPEQYDVIITDSSDPLGPAIKLFKGSYYALLKRALKPGGIICNQGGTVWEDIRYVREILDLCKENFPVTKYAFSSVPTYPTGQIGYIMGCLDPETDLTKPNPKWELTEAQVKDMELKYYNSDVHRACFILPNFVKEGLYGTRPKRVRRDPEAVE